MLLICVYHFIFSLNVLKVIEILYFPVKHIFY